MGWEYCGWIHASMLKKIVLCHFLITKFQWNFSESKYLSSRKYIYCIYNFLNHINYSLVRWTICIFKLITLFILEGNLGLKAFRLDNYSF